AGRARRHGGAGAALSAEDAAAAAVRTAVEGAVDRDLGATGLAGRGARRLRHGDLLRLPDRRRAGAAGGAMAPCAHPLPACPGHAVARAGAHGATGPALMLAGTGDAPRKVPAHHRGGVTAAATAARSARPAAWRAPARCHSRPGRRPGARSEEHTS